MMMNGAGNEWLGLGAFGFWLFIAAVVIAALWYSLRRQQMRNETIQKLIESGQPIDQDLLDKLYQPIFPPPQQKMKRQQDPRDRGRFAGLVFFLQGFGTLFVAFNMDPSNYFLALLGMLPLVASFGVWANTEKEYAEGILPAMKDQQDPRESSQGAGGFFFFIGYATVFIGLLKETLNLPMLLLGISLIVLACWVWADGEHRFKTGQMKPDAADPEQDTR